MTYTSINPFTNETLKEYDPLTREQTVDAIEQAGEAFDCWRHTSFDERKNLMLQYASKLRERIDEYSRLITLEMGKRISESREEIKFCAEIAEFYANGAEKFLADQPMDVDDADAYVQYAPLGVLLGIMPWNFPFYQVTRFAAPNIMAGNTVLVKHASNVPQCAQAIHDLFSDCGAPEGVYTNLFIPKEFIKSVIEDDCIQGVSLTGSEKAGAIVAGEAGHKLKRSVLELGGNDPFIVLEDADMKHVIKMAVQGRMT
ncbi:MAG TPA: succinate-semialdehyde dehydrogenase, partial [Planctomycetaceae bacterium]|nr:succinate-semialdehyde dehydrogenase [Planctomycetaceae bacterium]